MSGTINAAILAYKKSKAFTDGLAPATQSMRSAILERWRAEDGEKRIGLIQRHHIVNMLEPSISFGTYIQRMQAMKQWEQLKSKTQSGVRSCVRLL
jgi:hypothetical protein